MSSPGSAPRTAEQCHEDPNNDSNERHFVPAVEVLPLCSDRINRPWKISSRNFLALPLWQSEGAIRRSWRTGEGEGRIIPDGNQNIAEPRANVNRTERWNQNVERAEATVVNTMADIISLMMRVA